MQTPFEVCPYLSKFSNYVGRYAPKKNRLIEKHLNRPCHALVLIETAVISYESDGVSFVSKPGDIVLLPKGSCYQNRFLSEGSCIAVNFNAVDDQPFGNAISLFRMRHPETAAERFRRIADEAQFRSPGAECRMAEDFYAILNLIRQNSEIGYRSYGKSRRLSASIKYMEENFCSPDLNIEQIAAMSNVSAAYFRRAFSDLYRQSPLQYILELRVRKAKQLLSQTWKSVSEIAQECGFSEIFYFSKMFRRKTGLSPTEFREKIRTVL